VNTHFWQQTEDGEEEDETPPWKSDKKEKRKRWGNDFVLWGFCSL
jgi:hypothetical protein